MRKIYGIILALIAFAITSCEEDQTPFDYMSHYEHSVSFSMGNDDTLKVIPQIKLANMANDGSIYWKFMGLDLSRTDTISLDLSKFHYSCSWGFDGTGQDYNPRFNTCKWHCVCGDRKLLIDNAKVPWQHQDEVIVYPGESCVFILEMDGMVWYNSGNAIGKGAKDENYNRVVLLDVSGEISTRKYIKN